MSGTTDARPAQSWGAELRATFFLAWPLVVAQVAQNALFTTDVIMMGWLGPEYLAAGTLATAFFTPFLLLGGGIVLFDLEITGSWAAFALVAAALAVMEIALGFMLLALCRSVMQLNAITNAGTLVLGGLGGAMAPVELMPGWAQAIAPATPAYWAMKGFRRVTMDGGGLADVVGPVGVLVAFALVFSIVALSRLEVESSKVSWA